MIFYCWCTVIWLFQIQTNLKKILLHFIKIKKGYFIHTFNDISLVFRFSSPRNGDSPSLSVKNMKKWGLKDDSNLMDHMWNICQNTVPSLLGAKSKLNWLASKYSVHRFAMKNKKDSISVNYKFQNLKSLSYLWIMQRNFSFSEIWWDM